MAAFSATARRVQDQLTSSTAGLNGLLDETLINRLASEVGHRGRACFWRPAVIVITFLRQVLLPDCSCRRAVVLTTSLAGPTEARRVSQDPSAYSQARQLLPLRLFQRLAEHLVQQAQEPHRRWHGHRVRIVDGSGCSMPDTPELQERFPQSTTQKDGCGFPTARVVALFCWATGALLKLTYDSLRVGELQLFRRLMPELQPDDVVVADRFFGTYTEVALLQQRGIHVVFRVHNGRAVNWRRGQRLGRGDRLQVWQRPKRQVVGLSPAQWAALPERLTLRLVRLHTTDRQGFRRRTLQLVTTLLDPQAYPAPDLTELYRDRWLAEVSLRSLKSVQGMDVLRCQSLAMIEKELLMHQVAYNAIRLLMRAAAVEHTTDLRRLSFAGTQQRLTAVLLVACNLAGGMLVLRWVTLLQAIATDRLPYRPERKEPRALKRRHKFYPYLSHPRQQARRIRYYDGET